MKPWSPTALCIEHDRIIASRPAGDAACAALRRLRWYGPLLLVLPPSNIRIRHHLITAALLHSAGEGAPWKHVGKAARMLRSLCDGPYLEGWSYWLYTMRAYDYLTRERGPLEAVERIAREQETYAATMSLPDRSVPTTDTARGDLAPELEGWDCAMFATSPWYTVIRRDGAYCLVHHDPRLRSWRARMNLHVGMTFGRVVRTAEDWDWYTGWPSKKIGWRDLLWRVWCPALEVDARGPREVVLRIGGKKKTIPL